MTCSSSIFFVTAPLPLSSPSALSPSASPTTRRTRNRNRTQRRRLVQCSIATPTPPTSSSPVPLPVPPPHVCSSDILQSYIAESFITIVKVYSKSCRSCKKIERPFIRLSGKYNDQGVTCLQLCSEHNETLAQSLGVRGFPTFIFYKNGKRVDHFASNNSSMIEEAIEDLLL